MARLWDVRPVGRSNHSTYTYMRNEKSREVIGWIFDGGCTNDHCRIATEAGRSFHAAPAGRIDVQQSYHFASHGEALAALEAWMVGVRGLRMDLSVSDRITWLEGRSLCPGTPHRGHTKADTPCPLDDPMNI